MQTCSNGLSWEGIGTFIPLGQERRRKKIGVMVDECAGRGGGQSIKFIPDGLCFLSEIEADGI